MEIERKYLIDEKNLPADLESCRSVLIEQGYLCRKPGRPHPPSGRRLYPHLQIRAA